MTYVVPVAFVATVPARALLGGALPKTLVTAMAAAVLATAIALGVWRRGLRSYTSATS